MCKDFVLSLQIVAIHKKIWQILRFCFTFWPESASFFRQYTRWTGKVELFQIYRVRISMKRPRYEIYQVLRARIFIKFYTRCKRTCLMSGRCRFYSNIALARSPPLTAAVKVESVVGRQGKMADVGRASIRRGSAEYYFQNITNIQPCEMIMDHFMIGRYMVNIC